MPEVCAVILAAGVGLRLRPLTERRPKALCPVGNVPLLDLALARVEALGVADVAVNASYLADQVVAHLGARVHVSVEPGRPLGTAGALGKLRDWIAGRGVLVANCDAYLSPSDLHPLVDGWDGETVRMLGVPTTLDDPNHFGELASRTGQHSGELASRTGQHSAVFRFAGASLLPWRWVKDLSPEPAELVRTIWRPAEAAGALRIALYPGTYLDTGTPADYLAANLDVAGDGNLIAPGTMVTGRCERAVVGAGAVVEGDLTRSVVWPGGRVAAGEHLVDAVRVDADLTVTAPTAPLGWAGADSDRAD